MPSIESVKFDVAGLTVEPTPDSGPSGGDGRRVWYTADGDGVVLHFFDKPPDLPPNLGSAGRVREFYLGLLGGSPAKLVEAGVVRVAGTPAVRTIVMVPQRPSGMTYVGSLTLPFRDFSFVIKVQCPEHGTTGVREAVLLDRALGDGSVTFDPAAGGIVGAWDPDGEEHDPEFPSHPVSRLRRALAGIGATIALDTVAAAAPPFPLSGPASGAVTTMAGIRASSPVGRRRPRWWQFWAR